MAFVEVLARERAGVLVEEQDREGSLIHTPVELRPYKHPARHLGRRAHTARRALGGRAAPTARYILDII